MYPSAPRSAAAFMKSASNWRKVSVVAGFASATVGFGSPDACAHRPAPIITTTMMIVKSRNLSDEKLIDPPPFHIRDRQSKSLMQSEILNLKSQCESSKNIRFHQRPNSIASTRRPPASRRDGGATNYAATLDACECSAGILPAVASASRARSRQNKRKHTPTRSL